MPEIFPDPEQLYTWFAWGYTSEEVPAFDDARPALAAIFAEHGGPNGVEVRYRRYLWKAEV